MRERCTIDTPPVRNPTRAHTTTRLVEAKYPALLFKQQLDAFVQKIFPMLRDNVKKAITPLLVRAPSRALHFGLRFAAVALRFAGCCCRDLAEMVSGFPFNRASPHPPIHPNLNQAHCIHTPRGVSGRSIGPGRRTASGDVSALQPAAGGAAAAAAAAQGKAWTEILAVLDGLLEDLRAAYVPKPLVQVRLGGL